MNEVTTFLETYPEIVYGLSVCFMTFIVLKYLILKPTRPQKFLILFGSGLGLGILYYFVVESIRWPMMILAFLAAIGFYEVVIKIIMRKLHLNYITKEREKREDQVTGEES